MRFPNSRPASSRCQPSALRCILLALAGGVACLTAASAETIIDDSFEDAGGVEKVAMVESKAMWESSGNRTILSVVTDPEGLNSGNVLSIGNNLVLARFPTVELGVGSSLVLSFRFRSPDQNVQYPAPFRIGLCESTDDAPDKGETSGYWLTTGPGAERKTAISLERNVDSLIGGGNDSTGIGETFQLGYDWSKPHRLVLKIARPSPGLIEIHTQLDDEAAIVRDDSKESVSHFNLIASRMANTPQSIVLVDDIKLEFFK